MTAKYRSKFEENVANELGEKWEYEKHKFPYKVPRRYTPDFVHQDIVIEVKGYFRVGDTAKYKAIAAAYPDLKLVFIFSNPAKKVRKGAKINMGQWADKNGWLYTTLDEAAAFLEEL